MTALWEAVANVAELGGPVVMVLLAMSLVALALILAKIWQFLRLGVGRHGALDRALTAWDRGAADEARQAARTAPSHLGPVTLLALDAAGDSQHDEAALRARLTGEAAARLARLSAGLRLLDSVAQVAPLLGLFGTVLGMIEAFQGLQSAGAAVDPSALAGGIWVALLTTAVGLAVAMPASLVLAWFDARIAREAAMSERIIDTALCAGLGHG
ncbi:MotA/TolQ/ExbB proton channel family protein [Pararhodobacter sp.]|uniref:MotA/TolQ/ExbB proton channel family protein n=1 Tax=Pararhodobacter sp. TaxID=2127056 RepID=UPI002FE24385|nr:MotA/TolQ/ExbB proton channel family protein [Pseudomonadota bacterium]